uniref:Homologous recombination OB-fold protein OB-fold domain-containing protein n=2 Tax=Hordeum vulgare subsp. vulgare TaxID=112509 RepID=A0A8I6YA08_HORVV
MRLRSPLSSVPAIRGGGQAADADFLLDSWLGALRDLGGDRGWQQPGIGKIRVDRALDRACRVVGVVTLCTPNGYGDLILNLKDPSGTIDASVHKKVLSNENLSKGLSVGSVIVLKQVAVLRPSSTVCYLNVTQKNVEKVLQNDSVSPCKQAVPSSNSERQSQQPGQGDNMEREARVETSDGMTAILSKLSRTKDGQIVVLCDNGGAAKAVNSSSLRTGKDTHDVQNHHEKRVEQMDSSSQIKNLPGFSTSQQLQKIFSSMNPANCQLKQGVSVPKYGISSEAESSADDIMRKLTGGEMMVPNNKETTVAEGSRRNCRTHGASNNTSRMDVHASEKPQEIGLQKMVQDHSRKHVSNNNRDEHQQENPGADTRCTAPILGGSSVMAGSRDCTQTSCTGNLRQLSGDELMQPSSKKLKSDAMLSDGNGLDDIPDDFLVGHNSIRKPEHQQKGMQKGIHAASAGTLQSTQENCSISATGGTRPSSHRMVSVSSVPEWTDEQLSQLFDDY